MLLRILVGVRTLGFSEEKIYEKKIQAKLINQQLQQNWPQPTDV